MAWLLCCEPTGPPVAAAHMSTARRIVEYCSSFAFIWCQRFDSYTAIALRCKITSLICSRPSSYPHVLRCHDNLALRRPPSRERKHSPGRHRYYQIRSNPKQLTLHQSHREFPGIVIWWIFNRHSREFLKLWRELRRSYWNCVFLIFFIYLFIYYINHTQSTKTFVIAFSV